jgi:hypothetical protein
MPNPAYGLWLARDQQDLIYLNLEHTFNVWSIVEGLHTFQTMARVTMLQRALSNTKKLDMFGAKFIATKNAFASGLDSAERKADDHELKEHILNGLDGDTRLVASIR